MSLPPTPPPSTKDLPLPALGSTAATAQRYHQQAETVLSVLRRLYQGTFLTEAPSLRFELSLPASTYLHQRIEADPGLYGWYQDKVRYDYNPRSAQYTLRMPPTYIHESLMIQLDDHLKMKTLPALLSACREQGSRAASDLERVRSGRNQTLTLGGRNMISVDNIPVLESPKSPDLSFYLGEHILPTFIAEVSYTQRIKDLQELGDEYVVESGHSIRCVVGLHTEYKNTKAATVSVWRPLVEDETIMSRCNPDCIPFRDEGGEALTGRVTFTIADFLPAHCIEGLPDDILAHEEHISFQLLADWLKRAERPREPPPPGPKMRIRKRKRSPPGRVVVRDGEQVCEARRGGVEKGKRRGRGLEWALLSDQNYKSA